MDLDIIESTYLAVGGAFLGAGLSYLVQRATARVAANQSLRAAEVTRTSDDIASLQKAIAVLERDNAILKKDVLPLSLAVQQWAVAKLTHNHTPEMDELLTRVGKLNEVETNRLDVLLKERVVEYSDPEIDETERLAASMLLSIVAWVKEADKDVAVKPETLQLVSKPEEPEVKPKDNLDEGEKK